MASAARSSSYPSNTNDRTASGTGGTRLDHTTSRSPLRGWATRVAMFATPQLAAAAKREHDREQRHGGRAPDGDHRQTESRDRDACDLAAARPFVQQHHREEHREQGLRLQDERGQPGGHPPVDPDEQEAELADAEEGPDDQHPAEPDLRAARPGTRPGTRRR